MMAVADFFSRYGGPQGWIFVCLLVFYLAGSRAGMRVVLITLLAAVSNIWLKWLIAAPRPYYINADLQASKASTGFGMPSGHSQGVAAQWSAVAWQFRRSWLWLLALVFIVMTGYSRVYYGVHSIVQVLAGWTLGVGCVFLVLTLQDPLVNWFRKFALGWQLVFLTLFVASLMGISLIILQMRADFSIPTVWLENFSATQSRIRGGQVFSFYNPRALVLFGSLYGVLLMGLYFLRTGSLEVSCWKQRLLNVLLGCPLAALFLWLVLLLKPDHSATSPALTFLLLAIQPFLTIVLPLKLARRFTVPS